MKFRMFAAALLIAALSSVSAQTPPSPEKTPAGKKARTRSSDTGTPAGQLPSTSTDSPTPGQKTGAMKAPTAADISDAKAKGMVWVNNSTRVYHKDGQYYGHSKDGKFMTEADAEKAGYRPAMNGDHRGTAKPGTRK